MHRLLVLIMASVPVLSASQVYADSAALGAALQDLFAAGWRNSATALASAQPHYLKAQNAAPADARPAYAMALIAIKNSKHDDARRWLKEALSRNEHDLSSRRALIWVDLLNKQFPAGLSSIQAASESLAASSSATTAEERQAMANSLGRMIGYLLIVPSSSLTTEQLATAEQEILDALPKANHVAFLEGKSQALEKFEVMKAELAKRQDTAIEEQTEQKNLAQKKLNEDKGELAEAKDALSDEAKKVQDKYEAEESALKKELTPLARRLTVLDARARELRNFLVNVDREIERLIASASIERGRDVLREAALLREADRLRIQSRPSRDEFLRVDQEMGQVRAQGQALEGKLREAQLWLQGEMRRINGEGTKLARTEKGLKAVERKVGEPITGANSRVRVTATRLSSLSTYEEFPLEPEKQRLLESLR